jgi:hypothetical protein
MTAQTGRTHSKWLTVKINNASNALTDIPFRMRGIFLDATAWEQVFCPLPSVCRRGRY